MRLLQSNVKLIFCQCCFKQKIMKAGSAGLLATPSPISCQMGSSLLPKYKKLC